MTKITIYCDDPSHDGEKEPIAVFLRGSEYDAADELGGWRLDKDYISYGKARGHGAVEFQIIDEEGRYHPIRRTRSEMGNTPIPLRSDNGNEVRIRWRFVCPCGQNVPIIGVSDWPDVLDELAGHKVSEISLRGVRSLAGYTGRSAEKKGGKHYQDS